MNEIVIEKAYKLKDELKNSNEYINLKKLEKEMENNTDLQLLAYKKDMLIMEYEDALKIYSSNSKEVLLINKNIKEIIVKMNNFDVVKQYNLALIKYNLLLESINKEIMDL